MADPLPLRVPGIPRPPRDLFVPGRGRVPTRPVANPQNIELAPDIRRGSEEKRAQGIRLAHGAGDRPELVVPGRLEQARTPQREWHSLLAEQLGQGEERYRSLGERGMTALEAMAEGAGPRAIQILGTPYPLLMARGAVSAAQLLELPSDSLPAKVVDKAAQVLDTPPFTMAPLLQEDFILKEGLGKVNPESERLILDFFTGKGDLSAEETARALQEHFRTRSGLDQAILSIAGDPTILIPVGGTVKALRMAVRGLKFAARADSPLRALVTGQRGGSLLPNHSTFTSVMKPSQAAQDAFNLPTITSGLTRSDDIRNVGRMLTARDPLNPVVERGMDALRRGEQNIDSIGNAFAQKYDQSIRQVFDIDDVGFVNEFKGLHLDIQGAPGFSDLAENYNVYKNYMSDDQIRVMESLKTDMARYEKVASELEVPLLQFEGEGFYFPRGEVDDGIERIGTSGRGGKASAEKPRYFATHAEGLQSAVEKGYSYPSLRQTLASHVKDLGRRTNYKHVERYLLEAVDPETGLRLAHSKADRLPAGLRETWQGFGNKIRARRETVVGQQVRIGMAGREAGRAGKAVEAAVDRTARAEGRLADRAGRYTDTDIKEARADLTNAIKDVGDFAKDLGVTKVHLQGARRGLSKAEQNLFDALDELNEMTDEANRFLQTSPSTGSITDIKAVDAQASRLTDQVTRMAREADNAALKVDDLIKKQEMAADLGVNARQAAQDTRRFLRSALEQGRVYNGMQREWHSLLREQGRLEKQARAANARLGTAEERNRVTVDSLKDLMDEKRALEAEWKHWQRYGESVPHGEAAIDSLLLPGLQGYSFPAEVARAANRHKGNFIDRGAEFFDVYNNFYRGVRATMDLSAPGIQGLLAAYNAPAATKNALGLMMRSIGDERTLGAFMNQFDNIAESTGRLSTNDWARYGLRLGGGDTEMALGRAGGTIANLPGVKQANRAFGYYGDALRLQWADDVLAEATSGSPAQAARGLQEFIASGDMERLVDFVNNATGWSRNRAFGSVGDLLLFAPRFLNSRLTTLGKAMTPGGIDHKLARRSLGRLIGGGTMMTFFLNDMLGNETDTRPFLDDNYEPTFEPSSRMNPNFMRVRFAGRDWSLFGTWASLARIIVTTAGGFQEIAAGPDRSEGAVTLFQAVRGTGSGLVQTASDTAEGRTFMGEEVPRPWEDPTGYASHMLQAHLPFTTEEAGEIFQEVVSGVSEGDVNAVARGGAAAVGETFGIKSMPVTPSEERSIARKEVMVEMGLPGEFSDLDRPQRDRIDADARVKARTEEVVQRRRDRKEAYQVEYKDERDSILNTRYGFINNFAAENGYGEALREKIDSELHDIGVENRRLRTDKADIIAFMDDFDPPQGKVDQAITGYYEKLNDEKNPWIDPQTNEPDFDKRDAIMTALDTEFGADVMRQAIKTIRSGEPQVVQELRASREFLRPYWEITDHVMALQGVEELYAEWKEERPSNRFLFEAKHPELKFAMELATAVKRAVRETGGKGMKNLPEGFDTSINDPRYDRELERWGYQDQFRHEENISERDRLLLVREQERELQGAGAR